MPTPVLLNPTKVCTAAAERVLTSTGLGASLDLDLAVDLQPAGGPAAPTPRLTVAHAAARVLVGRLQASLDPLGWRCEQHADHLVLDVPVTCSLTGTPITVQWTAAARPFGPLGAWDAALLVATVGFAVHDALEMLTDPAGTRPYFPHASHWDQQGLSPPTGQVLLIDRTSNDTIDLEVLR